MRAFLLLAALPYLVLADVLCPSSEIACPESQTCCKVDGHDTCCDLETGIPQGKRKVFAGEETCAPTPASQNTSIIQQGLLSGCSIFSCSKCCKNYCCPWKKGQCCYGDSCCPPSTMCCAGGCCLASGDCCSTGCCAAGQRCCGTWCCKKNQMCGVSAFTCYGTGAIFTPAVTTLFLLAAFSFISKSYFV